MIDTKVYSLLEVYETGSFSKAPTYVCRMSECTAEYYKEYANKIKAGEMNED